MKSIAQILLGSILFLPLLFSVTAAAQDSDFPNFLSIQQVIAKIKTQNLLPRKKSEITIIGQIQTSTIIKAKHEITLIEAIASAGGLSKGADRTVRIIRKDLKFGYVIEFFVNLKEIIKGKDDPKLQDGDIVIVPKSEGKYSVEKITKPYPNDFFSPKIFPANS